MRLLCPWNSLAGLLEWVAISSSRGSFQTRDGTHVFCISRRILYHWATWWISLDTKPALGWGSNPAQWSEHKSTEAGRGRHALEGHQRSSRPGKLYGLQLELLPTVDYSFSEWNPDNYRDTPTVEGVIHFHNVEDTFTTKHCPCLRGRVGWLLHLCQGVDCSTLRFCKLK